MGPLNMANSAFGLAPCSRAGDGYILDAPTTMINVFDFTPFMPLAYHYLATIARILGWTLLFALPMVLYATKDITTRFFRPLYNPSPLRELKGPLGGGLMVGHAKYFRRSGHEPDNWLLKVFEKYGHVNVLKGLWNVCPSHVYYSFLVPGAFDLPPLNRAAYSLQLTSKQSDMFSTIHTYIENLLKYDSNSKCS
jgi:hypothetical protein